MKRAIVTGASRGIGLAIANRLSREGYEVLRISRDPAENQGTDQIYADLGSEEGLEIIKRLMVKNGWWGPIDVLVNNAGIAKAALLMDTTLDDHMLMMSVNYLGAVAMTQLVVPLMKLNKSGSIINVTSISGLTGFSTMSAYCASKFALTGFGLVAAKELAKFNIRVNNVCPGPTETDMWKELDEQYRKINGWETDEQSEQAYMSKLLIKRFGHPNDVADAVEYLVSDRASYITGTNFKVCGGNLVG